MTGDTVATKKHLPKADESRKRAPEEVDERDEATKQQKKRPRAESDQKEHAAKDPAAGSDEILEEQPHVNEGETSPASEDLEKAHRSRADLDLAFEDGTAAAATPAQAVAAKKDEAVPMEDSPAETKPDIDENGPPSDPPPAPPSKQYVKVREGLAEFIQAAPESIPNPAWAGFTDYIGEGVRARLLSLGTLHLTDASMALCPNAVRQMNSNSNKVMLGAAPNCELYQERVMRALAKQLGCRILVADSTALHFDDLPPSTKSEASTKKKDKAEGGSGDYPLEDTALMEGDFDSLSSETEEEEEDEDFFSSKPSGSGRAKLLTAKRTPPSGTRKDPILIDFGSLVREAKEQQEKAATEGKAADEAKNAAKEGEVTGTSAEAAAGKDDKDDAEKAGPSKTEPAEKKKKNKKKTTAGKAALSRLAKGALAEAEKEQETAIEETIKEGEEPSATANDDDATDKTKKTAPAAAEEKEAEAADDKYKGNVNPPEAIEMIRKLKEMFEAADEELNRASKGARNIMKRRYGMFGVGYPGGGAPPGSGDDDNKDGKVSTIADLMLKNLRKGDRVCYQGSAAARSSGPEGLALLMGPGGEIRDPTMMRISSILSSRRMHGKGSSADRGYPASAFLGGGGEEGSDKAGHPPFGAVGHVHAINGDKIDVVFDCAFNGGKTFPDQPEKCGFTCGPGDLTSVDEHEEAIGASFDALFDFIKEDVPANGPLVVFLPNMDKMLKSNNLEQFRKIKALIATLPPRCLFVGGYCTRSIAKEKPSAASGLSMLFGGGRSDSLLGADDIPPWMDRFGSRSARARSQTKSKAFASMLTNNVELHPPHSDSFAKAWKQMLDADVAMMRQRANRAAIKKSLDKCKLLCPDIDDLKITELQLTKKEVEQVVGAAVASAVTADAEVSSDEKPVAADSENKQPLSIAASHFASAAAAVKLLRTEAAPAPERSALKDLNTDQYERQLLSEVVPPEEIAVGFDDIGALDPVKNMLHEVVILPLQRPELFTRGALTKPTKGVLLFGPPGTGKTMLAKAVASESGAHFININMSAITSKWLGEAERLVRAVFSLAHKLSPSVIFIDEIDSFLARRGGHSHEHEAVRKMKTEFLAAWDGIRTKASDRVLVLAATNRPMDLDDAAIRRMPRRILVPLPDASNREKILKVILKDEEVVSDLDYAELGRQTDGYSGSDLKNLCIAAAYCPLREFLEEEKKRKAEEKEDQQTPSTDVPPVRAINMKDFETAMKQVTPSTHSDSASMSELQRWNEQYGEGGSGRKEPLVYYT